jgi:predicted permease
MLELFRRLRYLLNRRRYDRELAGEMELHRELAADAGRGFGNTLLLREESREAWGWTWIDRSIQDLRYASRTLSKSPGFTLAAILMLAIGIGVNVAAFGFFDLIVLRPLTVRDPDTLLRFERRSSHLDFAWTVPYPEVAFFRDHSRTLAAVLGVSSAQVVMEGQAKRITANFVTPNLFQDLGAAARLGRLLDPSRDETGAVISYQFWQSHFGADAMVAGKTIRLNGKLVDVLGVASKEFSGLSMESPDVWMSFSQQPYIVGGSHLLTDFSLDSRGVQMYGRLRSGLAPKAAEDELALLAAELRKQDPQNIWEGETLHCQPGGYARNLGGSRSGTGSNGDRDDMAPVIALVATLTLLILAVACGNLGSMLLARGVAREREISIRISVGAGRGRLIRQLFTESLVLAFLGSAAGLALGYVVLRNLLATIHAPVWLDATPDWRVLAFSIGIGFLAAILFGLTPAFQIVRQRHRATMLRQVLIGAQVAASCVLLIVAGLLVRALEHATSVDPGFQYKQIVSIDPNLAVHGYSPESARAYLETFQSRLRELPGIDSVALSSTPPLRGRNVMVARSSEWGPFDVHMYHVDPQFLQTLKIPILRGRGLMRGDTHAVVVSESLARRKWPLEDPLGKLFDKRTVVGIAGSARLNAANDPDAVELYDLADADTLPSMIVLVRTIGPPESVLPLVASIAKAIDPQVFPEVDLVKGSFRESLRQAEGSALVVSLLGFVAQVLACLGIVGVVAYAVSQRTKEIGIRMAMGARPAQVLSVILSQFSRPVVIGLIVGVGAAAALSQIMRRELYGISHLDPITYFAAIGVFVVTVAFAALLPARRALRVDPIRALRYE